MPGPKLADWLREHKESLLALSEQAQIWGEGDDTFGGAFLDDIIQVARIGELGDLDHVIGQAVRGKAVDEVPLSRLLKGPQRLKEAVWSQLKAEELPPPEILSLVEAAEPIFARLTQVITQCYFEVSQQAQDALASEIARMYRDSERQVLDRTAELTQANIELSKLEQAKTDFISIAAHELKTPLTLIQGYTNMLSELNLETGDGATGASRVLDGVLRGTERLKAIIEDMLDVSVIDTNALSLRIEHVSLAGAVNLVIAQLAQSMQERDLTVHTDDLDHLPMIEIDPRRLHQMLIHLLSNAIKYTPDGGDIYIQGRALPDEQSEVGGDDSDAGFIELTIRDTGIGIAPEDRDRIFEKFYRVGKSSLHSTGKVKFKGAGPGLGLPIAKGLAEAHGGRLWAESPGHDEINYPGSTFHLLLPVRAIPKPGVTATWVEPPAGFLDDDEGDDESLGEVADGE
jgi:signal transduction histidine kinase